MTDKKRQVVILAGGKGTRLKEVSGDLPKPMVPILGRPLLQYLIERCVEHGITDIKLLVSYKKEVIKDYFGDGSNWNVTIQYLEENAPLGTAGALSLLVGRSNYNIDLNKLSFVRGVE
jgi:NDP-sugar pyrophosphorylase family protein